jgi:long-chain fatty acid transport protein
VNRHVAFTCALAATSSTAHAGGLERPNGISARGVGMGGAFTAWADDATAAHFNPALLDETDSEVLVGGELVVGPRSYTPVADDGTHGPAQDATVIAPLPALGAAGRFHYDDRPSAFTLGAGIWNTFGGKVAFDRTGMPAIDAVEDAELEASVAAAVRVSDKLALGAALRLGLGLFSLDSTTPDAKLSASGVGLGMTLGAVVRPTPGFRIALAWRSPLSITTSGNGTIDVGSGPLHEEIEHVQHWPQQASLALGIRATPRVRLAAQLDWTQWSVVRDLVVSFPATPVLDATTTYREDWRDSWTVRLGADQAVGQGAAIRGGVYLDTPAVPDRTIERQYLDSTKLGIAAGGSVRFATWRIDTAIDLVLPSTRSVPNNRADTMGFTPSIANKAPGDYKGTLVTFELAVARTF